MAKETFDRSKPHVNIGTIDHSATLRDTASALLVEDHDAPGLGKPAPSYQLTLNAPASSSVETATVAFPIDNTFLFDPTSSGPAELIDFTLDVYSTSVAGTPDVEIAFAIIQDEPFLAALPAGSVDGTELDWTTIDQTGLRAGDFVAVDGDSDLPDFGRPFQFGYAFTGEYSTTALSVDLGIDNMVVEITTVPEPTSIGIAVAMGASLLWRRWWNNDT